MGAYLSVREAFIAERPLVIDSGRQYRRDVERRNALHGPAEGVNKMSERRLIALPERPYQLHFSCIPDG